MTDAATAPAPAKVNLFLRVLAREADGFHGLETLFCLVSLTDTLRAERRDGCGVTIEVEGAELGPPAQNLAVRAAELVLDATGRRFGVHLTLTKRIPVRAGLGRRVQRRGRRARTRPTISPTARCPGTSCCSSPPGSAAMCRSSSPAGRSRSPGATASDCCSFRRCRPPLPCCSLRRGRRHSRGVRLGGRGPAVPGRRGAVALDLDALSRWGDIGRMAGNDFESPVFERMPDVRAAFEALVGTRPLVCRMSGSGSTLFAIYRSVRDREDARMMLGRKHGRLEAVETLARPAPPVACRLAFTAHPTRNPVVRIGVMLRHYDQHQGGVRVYTRKLLRAMLDLRSGHEFVLLYRNPGAGRHLSAASPASRKWPCPPASVLGWDQLAVPSAVRRHGIDVLFNPKYSIPLRAGCPAGLGLSRPGLVRHAVGLAGSSIA